MFVFISCLLVLKNSTDLQQNDEIKKIFEFDKKTNAKNSKTKYQKREVKLKSSIDKKAILSMRLFSVTIPNKFLLLKNISTYF